ncbi:MAG: FecR domain-containing protein [Burkholderiales bacterium]|nr:FecR domain-containing protein [Burkholderiales bacterium]
MRGDGEALRLRSLRASARHFYALLLLGLAGLTNAQSPVPCSPALGRVVSLQGHIELQRNGTGIWQRLARLDTPVCRGDQLRAGLLSRAAMYISPETIVRLDQNSTLELVDQTDAETVLRFHQDELTRKLAQQSSLCGVGYFITRYPRKLRVRTPFYNAVVEGTEFQVAMSCDRGELAVFEGRVAAESLSASNERVLVESGQSTSVGIGETPSAIKTLVKPANAVQWALYYLPLTDVSLLDADALAQDCTQVSPALRSGCAIRRAEYLLRVGRAQEARAELSGLLLSEPSNGDVSALESIVAVVQNEKQAALDLAQRAVAAAPNAFRPYAALSYAQQANFKLEEAFEAAKHAAQLAPDSALLRARTAELQLSLGRVRSAEREALEAVRINPDESRAHLILGFVHLAQIDTPPRQNSCRPDRNR